MMSQLRILVPLFTVILIFAGCSSKEEAEAKKALIAAEDGAPIGQMRIAKAYHTGSGVPQNNIYAYMWMSLAVGQGLGTTAEEYLGKITADMSSSEIEEAKSLALKCSTEKGYRDC